MIAIIFILLMIVVFAMNPEALTLIVMLAVGIGGWLGYSFLKEYLAEKKQQLKKFNSTAQGKQQASRITRTICGTLVNWLIGFAACGISMLTHEQWYPSVRAMMAGQEASLSEETLMAMSVHLVIFLVFFLVPFLVISCILRWREKKGIFWAFLLFLLNGFFAARAAVDHPYEVLAWVVLIITPALIIWQLLRHGSPISPNGAPPKAKSAPGRKAVIQYPKETPSLLADLPGYLLLVACLFLCSQSTVLWIPCPMLALFLAFNTARKYNTVAHHKDYIRIQLPSNWPDDCCYRNYKDGLVNVTHRQKRIEELETLAKGMAAYGLRYKDKQIAMLSDIRDAHYAAAGMSNRTADGVPGIFMERESDWSIAGGIASGIAGPVAGVAAALDVQAQNAKVRAHNKAVAPLAMEAQMFMREHARQEEERAKACEELLRKVRDDQCLKILQKDTRKAFEQLNISKSKVEVSETGAVTVEADFDRKPDCPDTIDGMVAARLYRNGVLEASAYFVLPYYGIDRKIRLSAISTKPTDASACYTVKFEPVELWTIESL